MGADLSASGLSARTLKKKAEDLSSVKDHLLLVRDGQADAESGILMRIPFAAMKKYCIAGPLFAALLLHEYKLAGELIDEGLKADTEGLLVADDMSGPDPSFYEPLIFPDQLVFADTGIPGWLLWKLRDMKDFSFMPERDLTNNNLITILSDEFRLPSLFDNAEGCGRAPFGERLAKLKRKCPDLYDDFFEEVIISEDLWEQFFYFGTTGEVQEICRIIYKDYPYNPRAVLAFFNCETASAAIALNRADLREEELGRYVSDMRKACALLKEEETYYAGFVKTVFAFLYLLENFEQYSYWEVRKETESLVEKYKGRVKSILRKCLAEEEVRGMKPGGLILLHESGDMVSPGIEKLYDHTFSVEMYLNYLTDFLKLYKKITKRKITPEDNEDVIDLFYRKLENLPSDGLSYVQVLEIANQFSGGDEWNVIRDLHLDELFSLIDMTD